jgi:hypothetical protein
MWPFKIDSRKEMNRCLRDGVNFVKVAEHAQDIKSGRLAGACLKQAFQIYNENNFSKHYKIIISWFLAYLYGRMNDNPRKIFYGTLFRIEAANVLRNNFEDVDEIIEKFFNIINDNEETPDLENLIDEMEKNTSTQKEHFNLEGKYSLEIDYNEHKAVGLMKGENSLGDYLTFKNGFANGAFKIDYENNGFKVLGTAVNNYQFKSLKYQNDSSSLIDYTFDNKNNIESIISYYSENVFSFISFTIKSFNSRNLTFYIEEPNDEGYIDSDGNEINFDPYDFDE